jgi:hypothetical protein
MLFYLFAWVWLGLALIRRTQNGTSPRTTAT